jgi:hypothetical protein
MRLPDAATARGRVLPGEEREDRSGLAGFVAVVEVVGAGIVEVDGLLDEPQPQRVRVEVEICARPAGDGRDMMDALSCVVR